MTPNPEGAWERRSDRTVPAHVLAQIAAGAPLSRLDGGLVNRNYRHEDRVLRVWTRGAAVARRELALLDRVRGLVPVPVVFESGETDGWPWAWLEWVPGRRLSEAMADGVDGRPFAHQLGAHLVALQAIRFDQGGFFDDTLAIGEPLGSDPWRSAIDQALAGPAGDVLGARAALLRALEPPRADPFVVSHGDYKPTNVLVDGDRVTAILDWEFGWAGPRLFDVGQLLRWDGDTPGFADAFAAGYGPLPRDWRSEAARWDLLNLVGFLGEVEDRPRLRADVIARIDRTLARR